MNENAKAWIAALRSGKYQQAEGTLIETAFEGTEIEAYCCLGVACELAAAAGIGQWELEDGEFLTGVFRDRYGNMSAEELPRGVKEWLGVNNENPSVQLGRSANGRYESQTATWMNDSKRASFSEIADWLETHHKELFPA